LYPQLELPQKQSYLGKIMCLKFTQLICLTAVVAFFHTQPVFAHEDDSSGSDEAPRILGVMDFPNSGATDAQAAFEQGVLLLHSFEFDDARTAFLAAQLIDPGFAMAIWGEAMTLNHPLWAQQDRKTALEVLAKLPPVSAENTTHRERMYLEAVRILYGEGDKPTRDIAYMQAMRGIYEAYPDDLDAASFYALSILGSVYERDFRTYMKAAAILEEVFAKEPKHPGAAHYLIHSYDDQVHAPLGLRAAREYSQIAPGAAHAQHMVSHIYTSLGRWDDVVEANRVAMKVSAESLVRAGKPAANRSKHSLHWLEYALLQQGRFDEAKETLDMMKQDLEAAPALNQERHYVYMRGSWLCEIPLIDAQMPSIENGKFRLGESSASHFASGFEFMARGQYEQARTELAKMVEAIDAANVMTVEQGLHEDDNATSQDNYLLATIMSRSLESLLLFQGGDTQAAVSLLKTAVEDENARPSYYGPPHVPKPSGELLGEMLLLLNRPNEAVVEFEASLKQHTGRTRSLLGLARSAKAAGDDALSAKAMHQVETNWKGDLDTLMQSAYPWLKVAAD
jgi:tetratricopeptide (TPR) repeat protein